MRLLTELLPDHRATPQKRGPYLRSRLHGADIDAFALELARFSLTLRDIPNPNGWDLQCGDMFRPNSLEEQAKKIRSSLLIRRSTTSHRKSKDLRGERNRTCLRKQVV